MRATLTFGQVVTGEVIARAPFGVWLDIGASFPALLLVPRMQGAMEWPIRFEDYPLLCEHVEGRINARALAVKSASHRQHRTI